RLDSVLRERPLAGHDLAAAAEAAPAADRVQVDAERARRVEERRPVLEPPPPARRREDDLAHDAVGGNSCAISHMCPSGSAKAAVRTPQGRSIGPLMSSTPCDASAAHAASVSSTRIVSWKRAAVGSSATGAGPISSRP